MEEQDWQPVIVIAVSGHADSSKPRFRATKYPIRVMARYLCNKRKGYVCGAERFFEIHPDDSMRHWQAHRIVVCEHKVLAD